MPFLKTLFLRLWPRKIWQQIFVWLVLLVVIPLVILGGLLLRTSQKAIKMSTLQDHSILALHATARVETFIEGIRRTLFAASSILGRLQADAWSQEIAVTELSLRYPVFQHLLIVDKTGKEVASSNLKITDTNHAGEQAFQAAIQGGTYITKSFVQKKKSFPSMIVSMPIQTMGRVTHVLLARVNLKGLWDIADSIKCGKNCKAYVVDENKYVLSHVDKKLVFKKADPHYHRPIQRVLNGESGNVETIDSEGRHWLISYAPVKRLGWGLLISQPAKDAYLLSRNMRMQSWILILCGIFAAGVMSVFLSHFISRPLEMILERTKLLVRGNYTKDFVIRRRDEIGRLLFSFNRMATLLQRAREMERLSIVGRVAGFIAHELKNSLVMIKTYIKLLPRKHRDKAFIEDFSSTVPKELEYWNQMLRGIMDFSRTTGMERENVDINKVITDVVVLAKLRLKQQGLRLEVRHQKDLPVICGDPVKLKQVFLNLITNAIEASGPGDTITIETRVAEGGAEFFNEYVTIEVHDTGKGMSPREMERIFEPFYTSKKEGLGFGLATSRQIVHQHGGEILVESVEGKGTSFVVRIPVKSRERSV